MQDRPSYWKRIFVYPLRYWWFYFPGILFYSAQDALFFLYLTFVQKQTMDLVLYEDAAEILGLMGTFLLGYVALILFISIGVMLFEYMNVYITNRLQEDVFSSTLDRSFGKIKGEEGVSNVMAILSNDCSYVGNLLTYYAAQYFMPFFQLVGSLVVLFYIHPWVGVVGIFTSGLPLIYTLYILPRLKILGRRQQDAKEGILHRVGFWFSSMETVKVFSLEEREEAIYGKQIETVTEIMRKKFSFVRIKQFFSRGMNLILFVFSILYGVALYTSGILNLTMVTLIPPVIAYALSGVERLSEVLSETQVSLASMDRIFTLMDMEQKKICKTKLDSKEKSMAITFDHVTKIFPNGQGVKDASGILKPYKYHVLRGPIGCGKSTLMKIILGLEEKDEGIITAFGKDQDALSTAEWLSMFTYVEQEARLLNRSILENVLLGDSPKDNPRFEKVKEISGLTRLEKELPEGLFTSAGEEGRGLSGGQRQVVSFARALYSTAPILLLDEFSSALDETYNAIVLRALKEITMEDHPLRKTVLLITHMEQFMEESDNILEIQG
ncbi:MAG: ABC transporter ATP-binding protein [Tissierellia bacterium]|nr:ABC transporter ATP-binding protein [Tissierellia bacterium]